MRGRVIEYSFRTSSGVISGDDGGRYRFRASSWRSSEPPAPGIVVDFVQRGGQATSIYAVEDRRSAESVGGTTGPGSVGRANQDDYELQAHGFSDVGMATHRRKSKATAAVLAYFLGWIGVHKFYMGHLGAGFVMLLLAVITLAAAPRIISLIEMIIYLSKSDEEFHQTYVVGRRPWF